MDGVYLRPKTRIGGDKPRPYIRFAFKNGLSVP
jgi:hypothetical protein